LRLRYITGHGPENNLWFSINSPGQAVSCYLRAGWAAKVLARSLSRTAANFIFKLNIKQKVSPKGQFTQGMVKCSQVQFLVCFIISKLKRDLT